MRYYEIINEKMTMEEGFQSYAMDLLIPLYKKGIKSVSFEQFKKKMEQNPDVAQAIDIDDDFYMNQLIKIKFVDKVEPDPETKEMVIIFKSKDEYPHKSGEEDKVKKQKKIEKNATKQAKKSIKNKNPLV